MLVVVTCSWPSHSAITVMSTPARRRRMAAVCLRVWVVTCLVRIDGHDWAARAM